MLDFMPIFKEYEWKPKDYKKMKNKKSDFRKFCETMWIMTKHDVLPWVAVLALYGLFVFKLNDASKNDKDAFKVDIPSFFQKQR